MNFCWQLLNEPLIFDENHPGVLILENPAAFTALLAEIHELLQNGAARCGFYENNEPIAAEKRLELIVDPFAVSLSQKKIINALYARLETQMWNEEYFQKTNEAFSIWQGYLAQLAETVDYPLAYAEQPGGAALFKAFEVQPEAEEKTLLERLDAYLRACREFLKKDVFLFVNLHSYLKLEELAMLYKMAAYQKCRLLLLESHESEHLPGENRRVLDAGLCELDFAGNSDNFVLY